MGSPLIQQGTTALCAHGAPAAPTGVNPRVLLSGAPACSLSTAWMVRDCPVAVTSMSHCRTAFWTSGTSRVTASGQPLVVASGIATCAPSGLPLQVVATQLRVRAI